MRAASILLRLAALALLTGCGRPADTHWKDGHYKVYATDEDFSATKLGFDFSPGILGLVDSEVIAAGSDLKYVVVKRRSSSGSAVEYYIITKAADSNSEGAVSEPLNEKEYDLKQAALNLPRFAWNKNP